MDYISKKVEVCNSLDDFILKLKQGKMVKLANKMDNYYFAFSVSDNIKILYRKREYYSFKINDLKGDFCGILDCENNKLFLEKDECFNVIRLHNPSITDIEYYDNPLKVIKESGFDTTLTVFQMTVEQVDELLCRYQSDKDCETLEDKSLVKKDLSLDYKKEYDDIQKLAMGINNFLYISLKRLRESDSEKENVLMSCVMGYLDEGLDYLKDVDTSEIYKYRGENEYSSLSVEKVSEKYSKLYKQYTDVKSNIDKLVKQKIIEVVEDKSSVWINDNKVNKPLYDQDRVWEYNNYHNNIKYQDINTIKYKGKEIFNREKEIGRLGAPEYQASIDSLIKLVSNDFDRYGREISDLQSAGSLVYSKDGHFGVAIAKDKVYLDNGIQTDVKNVNFCFKDEELDKGLKQMRDKILKEYSIEVQNSFIRKQKKKEERER